MAITVKHKFVSAIPDGADATVVRPSNWNDDHDLTGTIPVANGGTGATTLTGYVYGNGTATMTASTTVPSTDITGLGTMSTQNANAVAVTGGTVNGTTIGATTASNAAFTYASTNSTTSTTPALSYNASNSSFVNGATVANSYLQNIMQNKSSTTGASTNFAVSNDLGTDSTYYGEFGMNSSVFSSGTPADFFSLNNGVYFSGHDGDISIGSGNGYKTYLAWGTTGQSAHVINVTGAIGLNTNITGTTNFGTSGQVLTSGGSGATPTWTTPATGTVTSVTGTAPVVSSGGATPAISMAAATTSVNGYLTSTDWTTFNGKQATLVSGTNIKTVSGTTLLGSGDLGVIGATYGGTGQSSYAVGDIVYASTTTALSKLADVATGSALISGGVGVAPSYGKIGLTTHVSGTLPIANGGTNSTATPTAGGAIYGTGTAYAITAAGTSGQVLTSNGASAPTWTTPSGGGSAATPTALGTVYGSTGNATPFKTFLGYQAGNSTTGIDSTAIGYQALVTNTTGTDNTAIGYLALNGASGGSNTAVGSGALQNCTSGYQNIAIGINSGMSMGVGFNNVAVGNSISGGSGGFNLAFGVSAGMGTGSYNIAMGYGTLSSATSYTGNIAIGGSGQTGRYISSNNNIAIGNTAMYNSGAGGSCIAIGISAMNSSTATGAYNIGIGESTLTGLTSGTTNIAFGYQAGTTLTSGSNNIIIGNAANSSSATASNEITLGNSSITSLRIPGLTITAGAKWFNNGSSTVALLPSASTAGLGARAFVTDALAPSFGVTVAGSGAVATPVYSDGTNWKVG